MDQRTIGNEVEVTFVSLGNRSLMGKVDTGATTSSLHATNIRVSGDRVAFICPDISNNSITMELHGAQEVHSADGGGQKRPMVKFDVVINGQNMRGVVFNLNDRSNMDDPVLIGQNILQAGNFIIDVNQDAGEQSHIGEAADVADEFQDPPADLKEAIRVILSYDIPLTRFAELIAHSSSSNKKDTDDE